MSDSPGRPSPASPASIQAHEAAVEAFLTEVRSTCDLRAVPPSLQQFFLNYLRDEPVRRFRDRWVINSNFPPFPSEAFRRFLGVGPGRSLLFSATVALTNRCIYECEHCYNANRSLVDLPTEAWKTILRNLQDLGTLTLCLSGGEPLLRRDIVDLCRSLDDRTAVTLQTTGYGWTNELAKEVAGSPVWAISLSLDSPTEEIHDRFRRRPGAFRTALEGIETSLRHGFYTVAVTVATRDFIQREEVHPLMEFAGSLGVDEVHLLEPAPAGRWVANPDTALTPDARRRLIEWQRDYARAGSRPALSSFAYIESEDAFGCGAGHHHVYVDGTGEISPCNLVGVSAGNVMEEPMPALLERLRKMVGGPCNTCLAHRVQPQLRERYLGALSRSEHRSVLFPVRYDDRELISADPGRDARPAFYGALSKSEEETKPADIAGAYDRVADSYDEAWLSQAAGPALTLLDELPLNGVARALDVGCGTGFATLELARRTQALITAVDLSEPMIARGREEAARRGLRERITFMQGDFFEVARALPEQGFGAVVSTWVLGYLPLEETFREVRRLLAEGGTFGFIVHRDRSPIREMRLFEELVARDPSVMTRSVVFGFPRDEDELRERLAASGLHAGLIRRGTIRFPCAGGRGALDHLLRSGAGTVYYDAIRTDARPALEAEFVRRLDEIAFGGTVWVEHEYFMAAATRATEPGAMDV